jgi:hypothetical protein
MIGPWVVVLHKGGKAVEIVGPEALVAVEPVHRLLHRFRGEPACDDAAGLLACDQAGIRQHIEMLHDRRQRHRERLGELADRKPVAVGKPRQQRAPRWVRQRGKGAVQELIRGLIVTLNHMV